MSESARDWWLVSVSGRRTSAQVRHAPQAQALGHFSEALASGRGSGKGDKFN